MGRAKPRLRQAEFVFPNTWGGPREGSGRKPKGEEAGVRHRSREPVSGREPAHVTVKLQKGLPSLRTLDVDRVLRRSFEKGCDRFGFRLVHYSVQSDHIHLLVEAEDGRALARGMQGLLIRVAKALNKLWQHAGSVFADRFHSRLLKTSREVKNALVYLLANARKHRHKLAQVLDRFASGPWFDGWRETLRIRGLDGVPRPVALARTWLLRTGWRRWGLISVYATPANSS
jgi:REP element-mobilizing transposase RayT